MSIISFLQSVSALFGYDRKVEKEFLRTVPVAGEADTLQKLTYYGDEHERQQESSDCPPRSYREFVDGVKPDNYSDAKW